MARPLTVAVVGAGWAGLAAAIRATQAGHAVTVFEAAAMPGGRARSDDDGDDALDNGQHILLGGYERTLGLMRDVGVDLGEALSRRPLAIAWPDGTRLALPAGGPHALALPRALLAARGFSWRDRCSLAATAARWHRAGFACDASLTVDALLRHTAPRIRERLLDPLCIAALNTRPAEASAGTFLAVLRDSLFGAAGAADLVLPRVPLARLLPTPARAWLQAHGATFHLRRRVLAIDPGASSIGLRTAAGSADERFDRVVLAVPAPEAARLAAVAAPAWSATAAALAHESIATLVLRAPHVAWPDDMVALESDDARPAQFAFRLGRRAHASPGTDRITLVASAASAWVDRGRATLADAAVAQARSAFGFAANASVECLDLRIDRRATFRCAAGVLRPGAQVAPGVVAAGDYVEGRYPATLEAAVRAGEAAAGRLDTP